MNPLSAEPTPRPGRRAVLAAGAALGAVSLVGAQARPAYAATPEDLGIALQEVNILAGAVGTWPDGRSVFYVVSTGSPAAFSVLDAATGERLAAHVLEGYAGCYAATVAPDGTVYFEARTGGRLFRYFPSENRLVNLGRVVDRAYTILGLAVNGDGIVFGGTYSNGHLFSYDPEPGEFRDYGVLAEGETYARLGAISNSQVVYAGSSLSARLFAVEPRTGERTEIPLPEPYATSEVHLTPKAYVRGLLFMVISPARKTLVYDTMAGEWIDEIEGSDSAGVTEQIKDSVYLGTQSGAEFLRYDLTRRQVSPTDFNTRPLGGPTRVLGVATFDTRDFPGKTIVGMGQTGRIWHWNPITGRERWITADPLGSPARVESIGRGPAGDIYLSGHFTSGVIARYRTSEDRLEQMEGPAQVQGFGVDDGMLYLGTYPTAGIMRYDPADPWAYGTNPKTLFTLSDRDQARPWTFAGIGDRVAIGTTAAKESLDGALTLYDPATGEVNYVGTLLDDLGVTSLAARGLLLAGGTSVRNQSLPPTHESARLFLWDAESDTLIWDGVPVADAKTIGHLVFDAGGRLWGLTNYATLFEFDVDTTQVLRTARVSQSSDSDASGGHPTLFFGPDQLLYGSTGDGELFRVDPASLSLTTLDTSAHFASLGPDGYIYYAKNRTSLYRLAV